MKHDCLKRLVKDKILIEVKWNQGYYHQDGIKIENNSDQDVYVLILEAKD